MDSDQTTRVRVPPAAVALDVVALALLAVAVAVLVFGATPRVYVLGLRWSVRTPVRPALAAGVLLLLRHWRVPAHPRLSGLARRLTATLRRSDEGQLFASPGARAWPERLLVTLGALAVVAVGTWPQIREIEAVPDVGDPLFSVWRIGWIAHALAHDPWHLFSTNAFYPERLTLTYSDPVLLAGVASAPFFWLGFSPLTIYTGLFLAAFVLSGVAMYYLVRALTGRRDAAAIAGVIFALYPYRFEHYSHLELQMTMWMPLVAWGLHRTIAAARWRDGLLTGLAFAGQTLSSLYYGLFLAVYLVPLAAVLWISRGLPWRAVGRLAAGALLAGVLIAPVAAQYIANRPMLGERPVPTVEAYSAKPADYLMPNSRSVLYHSWVVDARPERQLFPGIVVVLLAGVALWPPIGAARLGYALALVVAFEGSLGLNGWIYPFLDYFSAFRGLRVPARFSVLVGFSLAVLAGFGAARLLARWSRRPWLGAVLCILLVVIDDHADLGLRPAWHRPPDIYSAIPRPPGRPDPVIAEFPIGQDSQGILFDCRYVYFSVFHWLPTVNGNSGFFPPSWFELQRQEQDFPSGDSLAYLRSRNVQYVIVHGAFYADRPTFERTIADLSAEPGVSLVASVEFDGSESRLYRLLPP